MKIIKRVLNNNAVCVLDENGNEVILKGKGIAYRKSAGDYVEDNKIEQRFVLENQEIQRRYNEILRVIPTDFIETSECIIDMLKKELSHSMNDIIYITLTDHLSNLAERLSIGIGFDNLVLWDVKRLYPEEYQAALKAVDIIKSKLDLHIQEEEASFITLHIVNAEMNMEIHDIYQVTDLIFEIYEMLARRFHLPETLQDNLLYHRFILHLRYFLERCFQKQMKEEQSGNNDILEVMKQKYQKQYTCVEDVLRLIRTRYICDVSSDEKLYLLIHIVKLTS